MRLPSARNVAQWLDSNVRSLQPKGSARTDPLTGTNEPYGYESLMLTHERLDLIALRLGDTPAVCDDSGFISWKSLQERVRKISYTVESFSNPRERIGIYLENSINFVISSLAILKAGRVIVPREIELPQGSLNNILTSADIRWVLTDTEHLPSLSQKVSMTGVTAKDLTTELPRKESPEK